MKVKQGFTLIELLIVISVMGVLMAIAIPAFTEQMRASRRSEAFQVLSDIQLKQEKFRSNNAAYGTVLGTAATEINVQNPTSGYYTLALSTPVTVVAGCALGAANRFAATATAAGAQASDTKCATIVLTDLCGVITKTSTGGGTCWK
jgi:type IV pilus assembly protein PilE